MTPQTPEQIAGKLTKAQEWRDVPGYEGLYSISDRGDIMSLPRYIVVRKNGVKPYHIPVLGKVLARTFSRKGYPQASLHKAGAGRTVEVHRLLCRAFRGEPSVGQEVAHLDGNPKNCTIGNLAWVSRIENHQHKKLHGTYLTGERVATAVLSKEKVLEVFSHHQSGQSKRSIARTFGVSDKTIRKILSGKAWADHTVQVRAILRGDEI